MKIKGLSTFQIVDGMADIVLSVEFAEVIANEPPLTSPTVWVTYDLSGKLVQLNLTDEGIPVNIYPTDEEYSQILRYIDEHGLKDELFRQVDETTLLN